MDRGRMAQIDVGGGTVRLRFDVLEAEPGPGGHRLGLRYEATPSGLASGSTLLFAGQLRLQHGGLFWLGNLQVDQHLPVSATAVYPHPLVLSTTINNEQLGGALAWLTRVSFELRTCCQRFTSCRRRPVLPSIPDSPLRVTNLMHRNI